MMTQLTALYFPDTEISIETVAQELLFFEKIIYYRPVENGEAKEEVPDADTLCHGYAPVPFGEDLDRFKSLLKDLKGHENEFYSGQLSAMAPGQMGKQDKTSVTDLISTITKSVDPGKQTLKDKETLWQARLLLKLAEIMAREERELQEELDAITEKEKKLFDALKGDEDIVGTFGRPISAARQIHVKPETILKAWGHLFLADKKNTTTHIDNSKHGPCRNCIRG